MVRLIVTGILMGVLSGVPAGLLPGLPWEPAVSASESLNEITDTVTLGIRFSNDAGVMLDGSRLRDRYGAIVFPPEGTGQDAAIPVSRTGVRRVFTRPVAALIRDRETIRARTGRYAPDLTQCFYLEVPAEAADRVLAAMLQRIDVEYAYRLPERMVTAGQISDAAGRISDAAGGSSDAVGVPEAADRTRATDDETPDFSEYQEYLFDETPPHLARAWEYPWGKGFRVTVADIEGDCNRTHEELVHKLGDTSAVIGGMPSGDPDDIEHGTAVAGLLIANANSRGIKGICHESPMKIHFAVFVTDLPDAVDRTQAALTSGDIILIEMQMAGPNWPGGDTMFGMLPVEWDLLTRDAIRTAVELGRIVIEAGGNGSQNLDDPEYASVFGETAPDSGAIIVGAGRPSDRRAVNYTNYGRRVNLQGWAERINPCCQVWSTGYGNAPGSPQEPDRLYTSRFSGTSSAAAMVTGAAACVQSAAVYRTGETLSPSELRSLLIDTGYPQTGDPHIGPLPDVGTAIETIPFVELHVDLLLNRDTFTPGDPFVLSHRTMNPRATQLLTQYLVLQCLDDFFILNCDDGVCTVEPWGRFLPVGPGELEETFLAFTWPEGDLGSVAPGTGYAFYLGYTEAFTGSNMVGNYDMVTFGWYSN